MLLDSEGAFRHWKHPGSYEEQPWIDIQIYKVIRGRWVELMNEKIKNDYQEQQTKLKLKQPPMRRVR